MPSQGSGMLFELAVCSWKLAATCPSFRAQRSGVEKSFRAGPHAETAETAETPVISSETKWSREILLCRSIAKREKILHRLHGFSQKIQSDDELCSQASVLHGAGRRGNENKRHTNLRDGSL